MRRKTRVFHQRDISIVLSGEAGQGIQTVESLLLRLFKLSGLHVFSYSEFMSRIRGGNNSTEIRVSSDRVGCFCGRIDLFVSLHEGAMERHLDRITLDTVIMGDPSCIHDRFRDGEYTLVEFPLYETAKLVGGPIFVNLVIAGMFAAAFGMDISFMRKQIERFFAKSTDDMRSKNIAAADKGFSIGRELFSARGIEFKLASTEQVKGEMLLNGAEAIGLGGLAGGCNFISSYPMSPSTEVLVFFAQVSEQFDVIVEQAEDEICAINMALGSWYAGGRAMVTTSGGGFALMVEALSLAGAHESPVVIHLAQRPGPATGLPTRTEQGDLMFALFAGHGEFPRVIFAPGSFEEGFRLAQRAFYVADRYQVPVILLTDQYFVNSNYNLPGIEIERGMERNHIVKTDADYLRYRLSDSGITPRGIPGYGRGIVCALSDEHTEGGFITEDFGVRTSMVDKRWAKMRSMQGDILPPVLHGPKKYRHLLISWGSTLNVVREALAECGRDDTSFLHFTQIYPLHPDAADIIGRAGNRVLIENNATAQLGSVLKLYAGAQVESKILKYNGMPFMLEEIIDVIKKLP
jgi:2-oxoglutarate ferredoxin oxidoreductase subunit alpha